MSRSSSTSNVATTFARRWMLVLLFLNITTSANLWRVFGLSVGQFLYWVIIALAFAVVLETPYRRLGTAALVAALLLRAVQAITGNAVADALRVGMLGLLFVIAGARLYGEDPDVLHRQLVVFLALSIPVMFLQITGAHSIFMMWDTEYAHDPTLLTPEEYGTFKVIPVYPTLFVGQDEIQHMIGQARPVGLLYSNNVLSIFVGIAAALHAAAARTARLRRSDLVITAAVTLTMSLNAFATTLLVYVSLAVFGERWRKRLAFRLTVLLAVMTLGYSILFPGLFAAVTSASKFSVSLLSRGLDLAGALGLTSVLDFYADQLTRFSGSLAGLDTNTYSLYSMILRSSIAIPIGMAMGVGLIAYIRASRRMRRTTGQSWDIYGITGFACLLTQFGTTYIWTPSMTMILGLALFPLFRRMWPDMANSSARTARVSRRSPPASSSAKVQ